MLGKLFHKYVKQNYFFNNINRLYIQFGNRTLTSAKGKSDFKALSHAYRIADEVVELIENNFIKFPLKNKEYIKQIKKGLFKEEEIIEQVMKKLETVEDLLLTTKLPEKPNEKEIDKLLLKMYFF